MTHPFVPFKYDSGTCDTCGKPGTDHPTAYMPYEHALWKVMLKYGGAPSYYGLSDFRKTVEIKAHLGIPPTWNTGGEYDGSWPQKNYEDSYGPVVLEACVLDFAKSRTPRMDTIGEFAGTFADHDEYVTVVKADVWCACGELRGNDLVIRDKTLGELIWLAVKEGELE